MVLVYQRFDLDAERIRGAVYHNPKLERDIMRQYSEMLDRLAGRGLQILVQADTMIGGFHPTIIVGGNERTTTMPTRNPTARYFTPTQTYSAAVPAPKDMSKYHAISFSTDVLADDLGIAEITEEALDEAVFTLNERLTRNGFHVICQQEHAFRGITSHLLLGTNGSKIDYRELLKGTLLSQFASNGSWYDRHDLR